MHGRSGKCKLKEIVNLEDLGVDETVVLIYVKETGCQAIDCFDLAYDRNYWRGAIKEVMESGFRKIRANTGLAKQRLVFQQNV
jgi:hypothetical protein